MNKLAKIIIFIFVCQLAGLVGSIFTAPSIPAWYTFLNKPWFTPPGWVFGPVWIFLYTLMGLALFIVWEKGKNKPALVLFFVQLGLNTLWSVLFFGFRQPGLALAEIVVLYFFIILTAINFWRIDKKAGLLLLPYIVWVSLATALNFFIVKLN